jgi:hypothetical protein
LKINIFLPVRDVDRVGKFFLASYWATGFEKFRQKLKFVSYWLFKSIFLKVFNPYQHISKINMKTKKLKMQLHT